MTAKQQFQEFLNPSGRSAGGIPVPEQDVDAPVSLQLRPALSIALGFVPKLPNVVGRTNENLDHERETPVLTLT